MRKDTIRERWKKLRRNKNFGIQTFLIIVVTGYTVFFTSTLWFPASNDYVDATPYYKKTAYMDYEIYLTQWVYAREEAAMQIIVEFNNKGVTDKEFSFEAVEKKKGNLLLEVVLEESEYAVLQINNVYDKWKEISLRISEEESSEQIKFYTNVDAVEYVDELTADSTEEYKIARLEAQITYDQVQIDEKISEIDELQEENRKMTARIDELNLATYLSEQEAQEALETIERAEHLIETNQDNIEFLQEEIEELEKRSETIGQQIEQIKG